MKKRLALSILGLATMMAPGISGASVTLLEKDDWKVQMSGFVELDAFRDSTRSLLEVEGNSPIAASGTVNGDNGRTQFSVRNSRLAFTVLPPNFEEWKNKGYMEFDLLGYDPSFSPSNAQSEASFYTNPTLRVRHAYLMTENDGWSILAGQTWTLFGWVPTYVPATASVPPGPGTVLQRTPQVIGMKSIGLGEMGKLQMGVSIARPSQADANIPNSDAGVKYSYSGLMAGFAGATGDVAAQPLSVAVSGTLRNFAYIPASGGTTYSKTSGSAVAVDAMIPVLPSSDGKDVSNTITLTGEFTSGKGDADAFPGWTGNLSQLGSGVTSPSQATGTNLDSGQGGFDSSNNFSLVSLSSWNAQLQYHLPAGWHTFVTVGYASLSASGIANLVPVKTKPIYDKSTMTFVNVFHDLTPQIRVAVEYGQLGTHYEDDTSGKDNRYELNAYFRF